MLCPVIQRVPVFLMVERYWHRDTTTTGRSVLCIWFIIVTWTQMGCSSIWCITNVTWSFLRLSIILTNQNHTFCSFVGQLHNYLKSNVICMNANIIRTLVVGECYWRVIREVTQTDTTKVVVTFCWIYTLRVCLTLCRTQ